MGSLNATYRALGDSGVLAVNGVFLLLALPLLSVVGSNIYGKYATMPAAQAVVFFGAIGGISGLLSQTIAAGRLESLGRQVNGLELVPAIAASVLASAVATYALVPPSPNPVTAYLRATGGLPE